jgi:hypothetical protein
MHAKASGEEEESLIKEQEEEEFNLNIQQSAGLRQPPTMGSSSIRASGKLKVTSH